MSEKCIGYLRIVWFDTEGNTGVGTCGGAGFVSQDDLLDNWNRIPEHDDGSDLKCDRLDDNRDIVDEKFVSRETAETLLGESYDALVERARQHIRKANAEAYHLLAGGAK